MQGLAIIRVVLGLGDRAGGGEGGGARGEGEGRYELKLRHGWLER